MWRSSSDGLGRLSFFVNGTPAGQYWLPDTQVIVSRQSGVLDEEERSEQLSV